MDPTQEPREARAAGWTFQQRTVVATLALGPEEAQVERVGPDDLLVQYRVRNPRNVAIDRAYVVADDDWELGRVGQRPRARR